MVLAAWPCLKTIIVGIDMTPYWAAVCWFSSTLSLTMRRSLRSPAISSSTGATTRHGPHQGAQKSTRTGCSDSSTSAWKFVSVTLRRSLMTPTIRSEAPAGSTGSRTPRPLRAARGGSHPGHRRLDRLGTGALDGRSGRTAPKLRQEDHGLAADLPVHLRAAALALAERDRHLDHLEPALERAVGQLDLERVALRAHGRQVDRLEHLAAEALEAAGEVADPDGQHGARVEA